MFTQNESDYPSDDIKDDMNKEFEIDEYGKSDTSLYNALFLPGKIVTIPVNL